MHLLLNVLLIITMSFVIACQKNEQGHVVLSDKTPEKLFQSNPDTEGLEHSPWVERWNGNYDKRLDSFAVDCEGDACPTSVATFLSVSKDENGKDKFGVCGGALRDRNHVLSARHCIPKHLLRRGAACSENGYFLFPATRELPAASARCLEIVDFSDIQKNLSDADRQPDWVLIKLDRSLPERVSPLHTTGLKNNQKLVFYKPMYDIKNRAIKIKKYDQCKALLKSSLAPSAVTPLSPVLLIHCKRLFSLGYSGFAFYTEDGNIAATESHSVSNLYPEQKHSQYAIATNAACTEPSDDEDVTNACQWKNISFDERMDKLLLQVLRESVSQHSQNFFDWVQKDSRHPLVWDPISLDHLEVVPSPYRRFFEDFSRIQGREKIAHSTEWLRSAALVMSPAYPKCVQKGLTSNGSMAFSLPLQFLHFMENEHKQPTVNTQILVAKGVLNETTRGGDQFALGLAKNIPEPPRPSLESQHEPVDYLTGTYFAEIDIPSCQ